MLRNTQSLIETQNLRSYFSEELTRASENQSIEIDEDVAAYLTRLLTDFSNPSTLFEKTEDGGRAKTLSTVLPGCSRSGKSRNAESCITSASETSHCSSRDCSPPALIAR